MKKLIFIAMGAMVAAAIPVANADPVVITHDNYRDHRIERHTHHHDWIAHRHIVHRPIIIQHMLHHDRGWHNGYWHHHHHYHHRTVIIKHD